ncbi:MAG: hypothetical protein ABII20_00615 [Candidatus Omnitrophota bacterium]
MAVERTNDKKEFLAEAAGPPKAGRRCLPEAGRRRAEESEGDDADGWTKGARRRRLSAEQAGNVP